MSVLKSKRLVSKAEFVNVANEIYDETIDFLSHLSARYSRLIAEKTADLAGEVADYAEKANSILPTSDQRIEIRLNHLLEALASLHALDVRLTRCYSILSKNPQGGFTNSSGQTLAADKASKKLDNMAQHLGELIDKENSLLQGSIKKLEKGSK